MTKHFELAYALAIALASGAALPAKAEQPGAAAPRILGTAQSDQEFDAYRAVVTASSPNSMAEAAEKFIAAYPESGLAAYVHQSAVQAYQKLGDMPQVIRHGEAALRDLPANALLLALVSAAFLDQQQPEKSANLAKQALAAIKKLEPPAGADQNAWRGQIESLQSNVRLTLGSALLEMASRASGSHDASALSKEAVENLQEALANNPRSDLTSYRLGLAYDARHETGRAIHYYAWTVELRGATAPAAKAKLAALCQAENKSPEAAILAARAEIQKVTVPRDGQPAAR